MLLNDDRTTICWGPHGRRMLRLLATDGPTSRERLHRLTGLHRSLVGDAVRRLMDDGLVRDGSPEVSGRGRPRTPVTLDPSRRFILGVAVEPGSVSAGRINVCREPLAPPISYRIASDPLTTAAEVIREHANAATLAIGVSITGVVDVERNIVLESSSVAAGPTALRPLRLAAGTVPLVVENDLHALALYWQMHHGGRSDEDVLLVCLEDGAMGGALIVQGQPHNGCVHAASEIGHTCLAIDTPRCYCGRRGCLERVFDSDFARQLDGSPRSLRDRLAEQGGLDAATRRIVGFVGMGIANAIQLVKPHRLVLVSQYARHKDFREQLTRCVTEEMLASLRDRVRIDWWDEPADQHAVIAAYPALTLILGDGAVRRASRAVTETAPC